MLNILVLSVCAGDALAADFERTVTLKTSVKRYLLCIRAVYNALQTAQG
jgi:hypothetical protein